MRSYQIRVRSSKDGLVYSWSINIPKEIAEVVPKGMTFMPELTEEGILLRAGQVPVSNPLPSWAKQS